MKTLEYHCIFLQDKEYYFRVTVEVNDFCEFVGNRGSYIWNTIVYVLNRYQKGKTEDLYKNLYKANILNDFAGPQALEFIVDMHSPYVLNKLAQDILFSLRTDEFCYGKMKWLRECEFRGISLQRTKGREFEDEVIIEVIKG